MNEIPARVLAPGLVKGARRIFVAARGQTVQFHGQMDEESELLNVEIGAGNLFAKKPDISIYS